MKAGMPVSKYTIIEILQMTNLVYYLFFEKHSA